MLKNYLTVAIRHILRHKVYAVINVTGLAIGIACCGLILLYVQDELSFDRFHEKADQIYRVVGPSDVKTPPALGPALQRALPEVITYARLQPPTGTWLMRYADNVYFERKVYLADGSIFEMFSLPFIQGDPSTAFEEPYSVVISESTAGRYFGRENPIGKLIRADDQWDLRVTGVVRDLPTTSHFKADFFIPNGIFPIRVIRRISFRVPARLLATCA